MKEAFRLVKDHPALIIIDLSELKLDGVKLCNKIKGFQIYERVPIILTNVDAIHDEGLRDCKANAFLSSGATENVLQNTVRAWLMIYRMEKERTLTQIRVNRLTSMSFKKLEETQAKILASERLMTVLANTLPVLVAYMDIERRYRFVNNAYQDWFGIDPKCLLGTHVADFVGPAVYEKASPNLDRAFEGEVIEFEQRAVYPSGAKQIRVIYTPVLNETSREVEGVVSHVQDVSEQHATSQKILTALEELKLEREMRERFVLALTHDLRTPLTSAKISAQMLSRKTGDEAQRLKMASRIVTSMERADHMIRDLLDASRINSSEGINLEFEECHLNQIVRETIDELVSVHGPYFRLIEHGDIFGFWDRDAMRRTIENLLTNGFKYGDTNGPVTITLTQSEGKVRITVHNSGNPIHPDDQKNIFEPFKRAGAASSSSQKGWGIGLTLVKGLTEAQGGEVMLSSSQEGGTMFTVILPADSRSQNQSL